MEDILGQITDDITTSNVKEEQIAEQPKRGRGRPKKVLTQEEIEAKQQTPKRGRGRPKKNVETVDETQKEAVNLFDLDEEKQEETFLPGMEEEKESNVATILPGFDTQEEENTNNILPGFEELDNIINDDSNTEPVNQYENVTSQNQLNNYYSNNSANEYNNEIVKMQNQNSNIDIENLLSRDKKIVSFVGTSKNGSSFLVNNLGELLSSIGINTAILDMTKNKNSYFIYTKNEENLRRVALNSINSLANGTPQGIQVNKNLTVYTSLPEEEENTNYQEILETLVKNYSLVLIDCDFDTNIAYFRNSQEIYLVQSMDILTIQPLTAFLRDLKAKNVLSQEKIRIVINKQTKIRTLNPKVIIGGMANYNDPSMSFMTELFNKDNVKYTSIPFDEQVYSKYLEGLVNCKISTNGYSKYFMTALRELGNMVYPLLNNKYRPVENYERRGSFSSQMSSTLNKMKKNF